jgi:hypothetical protein
MPSGRQIPIRRRRWRQEVYDRAQELLNEMPTPTGAYIATQLEQEFGGHQAPSERTVNDWINRGLIALVDEDGPWDLHDAEPEDVPHVLEVARFLTSFANEPDDRYMPKWPTRAVAREVVRIRRAYPDLDDVTDLYVLASMSRRGQQQVVAKYLAFTPWRNAESREALFDAVNRGLVEPDALIGLKSDFEVWAYERGRGHEAGKRAWEDHIAAQASRKALRRRVLRGEDEEDQR